MKENQIIITDKELPKKWLDDAIASIESTKSIIEMLIKTNQMDLYDNDEDLPELAIKNKQAIKEHNVILPLTYSIEKMIKALVLKLNDETPINRNERVMKILRDIKNASSIKGNFHDLMMYIEYINSIDDTFIDILGRMYKSRREGYENYPNRSNKYTESLKPVERVKYASEMYRNAFINYRYQFEKQEQENTIDIVKLMDYAEAIRDTCLLFFMKYQIIEMINNLINDNTPGNKKNLSQILKEKINERYHANAKRNEENMNKLLSDVNISFGTLCHWIWDDFIIVTWDMPEYKHAWDNNRETFEKQEDIIKDLITKTMEKQRSFSIPTYAKFFAKISKRSWEKDESDTKIEAHEIMPLQFYYCGELVIQAFIIIDKDNNAIIDKIETIKSIKNESTSEPISFVKQFLYYLIKNEDIISSYFNKPINNIIYENYILTIKDNIKDISEQKKH